MKTDAITRFCTGTAGVQRLVFISRDWAESMRAPVGEVIISVHDVSEQPAELDESWSDRLTLQFHDTEDEEGVLTPYGDEHARQVLGFAFRHQHTAPAIWVHCTHGRSRSAGIALALSELLGVCCYKGLVKVDANSVTGCNQAVLRRTCRLAQQEFGVQLLRTKEI